MTLLSVRHITRYTYKALVRFGEHRLMLRPRDSFDQHLKEFRLDIFPRPENLRWLHDVFGNCIAVASFADACDELVFEANMLVDHESKDGLDFSLDAQATSYPFS